MRISDWSSDVCSSDLNVDARLHDTRLRRQVGAGRQVADQTEPGQQQRAGTLRGDQVTGGIELQASQQGGVLGNLARPNTASVQHYIRLNGKFMRAMALDGHEVGSASGRAKVWAAV